MTCGVGWSGLVKSMFAASLTLMLITALAVFMAGCGEGEASARGERRLVLTGSSTVAPVAREIARRFEAEHPGVRIEVQAGGSSRGIADVQKGLVDIGMASRALKGKERQALRSFTIARDGIGLIVHERNPLDAITKQQVVGIYTGRVKNWSELRGENRPISVIHKAEGRATLEVFLAHFGLDNGQVAPDMVIGHNEQGIKAVAGNPGAIGYVSIGAAEADIANGTPIKLLTVGNVEPTMTNVASGAYPIARPLNLLTGGEPGELARRFIDFARSEAAHEIIRDLHLVPAAP